MKLIQRRAYGFRSFSNYRLRVIQRLWSVLWSVLIRLSCKSLANR